MLHNSFDVRHAIFVCWICLICSCDGSIATVGAESSRELCRWDKFNTSCPRGSVALMRHALYGRMEQGRCVHNNYGHLGCSSDVLPYIDRRCSGRLSCSLELPDSALERVPRHPCPPDLEAYLEVSYICIPVETAPSAICSSAISVSGSSGYLSNGITEASSKGSFGCPWLIKGSPGQTIKLTLWDFGVWKNDWTRRAGVSDSRSNRAGYCHVYGEIEEPATGSSVKLCGAPERESVVYESDGEHVLVHLIDPSTTADPVYFFLQYEVVGCGDLGPVAGATVTSEGDTARVRCEHGGAEWQMICVDGVWVSHGAMHEVANCTGAGASWGFSKFMQSTLSLPQGILIALILGIAVLIAVIIFAFGVLSLRKRRRQEQAIPLPLDDNEEKFSRQSSYAKEQYPMLAKPERLVIGRESDYATTLQRHLAVHPTSPSLSEHLFMVSPSTSECCPVHGHYDDHRCHSRMSTFKPGFDHIYESPRFERREFCGGGDGRVERVEDCSTPFYHELERDAAQMSPTTFLPPHCLMYNSDSPEDPCG